MTYGENKFLNVSKQNLKCLNEKLEKDDTVGPYKKSLLYMVSRAFEENKKDPILGMKIHHKNMEKHNNLSLIYSEGKNGGESRSFSETHGGFDNDINTMNSILKRILDNDIKRAFTDGDLEY
jgi:hypothetical protein